MGSSSEGGFGEGVIGLEDAGSVDARRYGHWRRDWQEGQSHWDGKKVCGLVRRSRG